MCGVCGVCGVRGVRGVRGEGGAGGGDAPSNGTSDCHGNTPPPDTPLVDTGTTHVM